MSYPSSAAAMADCHEERIQRLESSQQQIAVQSKEALLRLDHLSGRVDEGNKHLIEHLTNNFKELGAKIDGTAAKVEALTPRIDVLERDKAKWAGRLEQARKIGFPVLIAAASVIVTRFSGTFWEILLKAFTP